MPCRYLGRSACASRGERMEEMEKSRHLQRVPAPSADMAHEPGQRDSTVSPRESPARLCHLHRRAQQARRAAQAGLHASHAGQSIADARGRRRSRRNPPQPAWRLGDARTLFSLPDAQARPDRLPGPRSAVDPAPAPVCPSSPRFRRRWAARNRPSTKRRKCTEYEPVMHRSCGPRRSGALAFETYEFDRRQSGIAGTAASLVTLVVPAKSAVPQPGRRALLGLKSRADEPTLAPPWAVAGAAFRALCDRCALAQAPTPCLASSAARTVARRSRFAATRAPSAARVLEPARWVRSRAISPGAAPPPPLDARIGRGCLAMKARHASTATIVPQGDDAGLG